MTQNIAGEIYPGISVDPAIVHGKPVIAGTRVLASQVVGHLAAGDTIETICEAYNLTPSKSAPRTRATPSVACGQPPK